MALSLVTAPAGDALTLNEARVHLKVDGHDEDALIAAWVAAAGEYVEVFTHRALLTQTWDLKLDAFPLGGYAIELPTPPVTAITSITYLDTAGVSQAWSSSLYVTDLPTGPKADFARITPAFAQSYPPTRSGVPNTVTVRFVCGYGSSYDVPASIKAAMLLLIGHWYQNREAVNIGPGVVVSQVPVGVEALLWPFKAF